jgi:hypothetical protein
MEQGNYNSLADYRKNQTQNAQGMLGVAQGRNRIAQGELDLGQNRLTFDRYKQAFPVATPTHPSASGVDTAAQSVMAEMSTLHPGLVQPDPTKPGNWVPKPAPAVGTPEYFTWKSGMDEMQRRIQQRASGQMDFGIGGGSSGDNPYEDLGEEQ